jgi:hypothetical protein
VAVLTITRRHLSRLPDPFRVLQVQQRLSRLTEERNRLEHDDVDRFAVGFHLQAVVLAYEHTLQEACWLAEIPVSVDGAVGRLLAEASLQQAGWSW